MLIELTELKLVTTYMHDIDDTSLLIFQEIWRNVQDKEVVAWEHPVVEQGWNLPAVQMVVENILVPTQIIFLVGWDQWTRLEGKDIMTHIGIVLILVTRGRGALKKTSHRGGC